MTNAKRLDEKAPEATVPLTWDFTTDFDAAGLASREIIEVRVTVVVDQSMRRGIDATVDDMLVGESQFTPPSKVVMQMATGGVKGVDYKFRCEVDVDSTPMATLVKTSILPVRAQ